MTLKSTFCLFLALSSSLLVMPAPILAINSPNGFYINIGGTEGYYVLDGAKVKELSSHTIVETGDDPPEILFELFVTNSPMKGTHQSVLNYNVALGYAYDTQPFRIELAYLKNDFKYDLNTLFKSEAKPQIRDFNNKISSSTIMLNGYTDMLMPGSRITPYAMFGMGYVTNKSKWSGAFNTIYTVYGDEFLDTSQLVSGNEKYNSLAYQIGVGARFKILNNLFASLDLRYIDLGKTKLGNIRAEKDIGIYGDLYIEQELKPIKITAAQINFSLTLFFGDQSEPTPSLL